MEGTLVQAKNRLGYGWVYDIDEETFQAMLDGKATLGRRIGN